MCFVPSPPQFNHCVANATNKINLIINNGGAMSILLVFYYIALKSEDMHYPLTSEEKPVVLVPTSNISHSLQF